MRISGSGATGSLDVSVDTEKLRERLSGVASIGSHDVFRRALGHNLSALLSALRSQVDDPIRGFDDVEVVLDDDHRVP